MLQPKQLKFRPYARLLTMLGEQLIKDERVALVELIKNAYDADADWVKVSFEGFSDSWKASEKSRIVIEDNGTGMTEGIIRDAWMNPASFSKKNLQGNKRITPVKGRVIQGEKGIGRFAMLKLGTSVTMITRPQNSKEEFVVSLDFSGYEDEFTKQGGKAVNRYLDELQVPFIARKAKEIVDRKVVIDGKKYKSGVTGTKLIIEGIRTSWNQSKVDTVVADAMRLLPIFSEVMGKTEGQAGKFAMSFVRDDDSSASNRSIKDELSHLRNLLNSNAVLKITNGRYDAKKHLFAFRLNGRAREIPFDDFRSYVYKRKTSKFGVAGSYPSCGSFGFSFYVFDFKPDRDDPASAKFRIEGSDEVELIKRHRIYLYRDGVRVYPYGEPDDDWLQVDVARGTISAGYYLSNDQVVGCVDITHDGNPGLRDKTSREGLVSDGDAVSDFLETLKMFLRYIRKVPYTQYKLDVKKRKDVRLMKMRKLEGAIGELIRYADQLGDPKLKRIAREVKDASERDKTVYARQAEILQDLAGVGLSVETASHDMMLMMAKAYESFDKVVRRAMVGKVRCNKCLGDLQQTRGLLSFIETQMRNQQSLFRSSRQRPHELNVKEVFDSVYEIYRDAYERQKPPIELSIKEVGGPLVVRCTDAVLMQVFINLLDNSLSWLMISAKEKHPAVTVTFNSDKRIVVFSDNGPGIPASNADYVFDPFFSTKEDGRGLGLYIAKQLLNRMGYDISLSERSERVLSGANLTIDLNYKEEQE